jgi:hypothetical protein
MIDQQQRDAWYADAKKVYDKLSFKVYDKLSFNTDKSRIEWLRQAFLTNHVTIESLRFDMNRLQELALSKLTRAAVLTVEEAQMLNCCRICHTHPPRMPTLLDGGKEFACQECVDSEAESARIRGEVEKAIADMKEETRPIGLRRDRSWCSGSIAVAMENNAMKERMASLEERLAALEAQSARIG